MEPLSCQRGEGYENSNNYFENEGKEIVIEKLLNSFLYMEQICYEFLKEKINDKFNWKFNEGKKNEIIEYFDKKHNDKIITKKEISSVVRRFIIRYLLNGDKKENIDPNLNLYVCLERKYLWNNKIFSLIGNNFKYLIKKYLDSFSYDLEARHPLEFYNFIRDEEKNFITKENELFAEKVTKPKDMIKIEEKKILSGTLGLGGIKPKKSGKPVPKTKNESNLNKTIIK